MVMLVTFLAAIMFFWLELFSDLASGNMQVRSQHIYTAQFCHARDERCAHSMLEQVVESLCNRSPTRIHADRNGHSTGTRMVFHLKNHRQFGVMSFGRPCSSPVTHVHWEHAYLIAEA